MYRTACVHASRALLGGALSWVVMGCAGSADIRGAASVVGAAKSCPEVTNLVAQQGADWAAALGIDAGDAATLKAGFAASAQLEQHAVSAANNMSAECSGLAADLGDPVASGSADQACQHASEVVTAEKARLGQQAKVLAERVPQCTPGCTSECDVASPKGPCASSSVTIHVSGASDAQAAARYAAALQKFLPSILAAVDAESDAREFVSNAKAAIELGIVTGRAVSDGDVASAAAAAICILPPLVSAKQHLSALRDDLHVLTEIATTAGLTLPKLPSLEMPAALHTNVGRGAPPTIAAPVAGRLQDLFAFPDGGFAAQEKDEVVALPGGEVLLNADPRVREGATGQLYCTVGAGHRVACLRDVTLTRQGRPMASQVMLFDSASGNRVVARVASPSSVIADGIAFDSSGGLLYSYTLTEVNNNRSSQQSRLVRGGQEFPLPFTPEHASLEDIGSSGRSDAPVQFFDFQGHTQLLYRDGRTLLLAPADRPGAAIHVAERSSYDVRPIVGGDGQLYIFYYEPKSRTLRAAISADGQAFHDLVVDSRESGWQIEAIPTADGVIAVYYFFRNSYNKGLRAVALRGGTFVHPPISIVREDRWNTGWHLSLASDRSGEVWLSYLSNVEADTRVWSHFAAASNLLDYAMTDNGSWEDSYKSWFVQAGAGFWYTWWNIASKAASGDDVDGAHLNAPSYHVNPAFLISANLEARIGPVDLGLSYAQNYVDKEAKKLGDSTGVLSGQVKIDDLLPGHDVKAEGLWGRYHGTVTRAVDGADSERSAIDTNYVDIHLLALNQWRIKYGLAFTKYSLPTPVQAYSTPANQTHYTFATSELRNVHYNNIDLALGYSKLDYLAKYENSYFGPILDATVTGGVTLATFDAITTPDGDVTSGFTFNLHGDLRLGWLWMDRFRGLAGLGIYVRPAYNVEGGMIGTLGRPDDRAQKDADKADTESRFSLLSLRHGPWLDAGLVW